MAYREYSAPHVSSFTDTPNTLPPPTSHCRSADSSKPHSDTLETISIIIGLCFVFPYSSWSFLCLFRLDSHEGRNWMPKGLIHEIFCVAVPARFRRSLPALHSFLPLQLLPQQERRRGRIRTGIRRVEHQQKDIQFKQRIKGVVKLKKKVLICFTAPCRIS